MMKKVVVYTDGACKGNPGPGGFGVVLRFEGVERIIEGAHSKTTNNQMELLAVCKALESLKENCEVDVFTDSQYVKNGITEWIHNWLKNNWRNASRKPVKNQKLWKRLLKASENHEVNWHWVKGHAGNPGNERADRIATDAIKKLQSGEISEEIFEA